MAATWEARETGAIYYYDKYRDLYKAEVRKFKEDNPRPVQVRVRTKMRVPEGQPLRALDARNVEHNCAAVRALSMCQAVGPMWQQGNMCESWTTSEGTIKATNPKFKCYAQTGELTCEFYPTSKGKSKSAANKIADKKGKGN